MFRGDSTPAAASCQRNESQNHCWIGSVQGAVATRHRRNDQKIEALAEIICGAGDEAAAALFVLTGALENARDTKLLANAAKHLAFTRCGESNLYGMVYAQLSLVEGELLAS